MEGQIRPSRPGHVAVRSHFREKWMENGGKGEDKRTGPYHQLANLSSLQTLRFPLSLLCFSWKLPLIFPRNSPRLPNSIYINPLSVSLLPKYYRSNRNSVQEWGPIIAWRAHRSFSPEGLVWAEPRHPLISRGLNCLMTGVFITSPIVAVTTIAMIPMAATLSGGLSISGTSPIACTVR